MFYRACTAAPADMCSTLSATGSSKQATWKVRLMTAQQVLQDFDLKKKKKKMDGWQYVGCVTVSWHLTTV